MDNKKFLIIIIITLIIIIGLIISILILNNIKNNTGGLDEQLRYEQEQYIYMEENPGQIINGSKPTELKYEGIYFTIKKCLSTYLEYLNNNDNHAIYNLTEKKYIEKNNIAEKEIISIMPKYENVKNFKMSKVYGITGQDYSTFYIIATVENSKNYFIVNLDSANNTYSIEPINSEIFNNKINEVIQTDAKYEETIAKNEYNTLSYAYLSEADIVDKYFQDYLENIIYNVELAYESLDSEYREKKFKDINEYKQYIKQNQENILKMCKATRKSYEDFSTDEEYYDYYATVSNYEIKQYKIELNDNGKKIICIDNEGKYYIFNISSIMNYTVILDTYTLDLPEFIEKYNSVADDQKVLLNIQKFFEALNNKDYNYAYSKLDETFKANNFKTQAEFEKYIKSNFFESNKISYSNGKVQGDIYLYDITISDSTGKDTKSVTKSFVMKLKEGTDFVMSFSVE